MARPVQCRRVGLLPPCSIYKPAGIPVRFLEEVVLTVDEFEAVRLADLEGMYQEHAAEQMKVSRQTFGRIIESARKKIADALVAGKSLRIEGGEFRMPKMRTFKCTKCDHSWQVPFGTGRPMECPQCKDKNIHRSEDERGMGDAGRCRRCGRGNK